jgi:hypothetical protein
MSASDRVSPASRSTVHPSQTIPVMSLSLDQLKHAWHLKHDNVSAGTPAYWAMRAEERDDIYSYASQFVSDPSSYSEEDTEIKTVLTPEEQMNHDYNVRRDSFLKQPLSVWTAMYDLHGWTTRVQRE